MNDREALLVGAVCVALSSRILAADSGFTYEAVDIEVDADDHYTNRVLVHAADGAVFALTVEQVA